MPLEYDAHDLHRIIRRIEVLPVLTHGPAGYRVPGIRRELSERT